jgi:ABC-type xylose transport system permease subunit
VAEARTVAADSPAAANPPRRRSIPRELPLLGALIAVCIVFQLLTGLFLSPRNLGNLLTEATPLGFVAVAAAIMILMGEIDLSLGSVAGLTAAVTAVLMNMDVPWGLAALAGLGVAASVGIIQGIIVVFFGVRSFVVTLAGYLVCFGLQMRILQPNGYVPIPASMLRDISTTRLPSIPTAIVIAAVGLLWLFFRAARTRPDARLATVVTGLIVIALAVFAVWYLGSAKGVPLLTTIVLAITAIVWFILTRTGPGLHLYAIGGDIAAAEESGIRVTLIKSVGFVSTSILAGMAGLALISYTSGADTTTGTGTLLLAGIGAAVVGGVSLLGGRGSVWGALGGALLLAGVGNGLNLLSLTADMVYVVEGLVVISALLLDAQLRRHLGAR